MSITPSEKNGANPGAMPSTPPSQHDNPASASQQQHCDASTVSIGSGKVCIDIFRKTACEEDTEQTGAADIYIYHPLESSDIQDISSERLWFLHDRLQASLAIELASLRDGQTGDLVARQKSWALIDMLLSERLSGNKPEPSSSDEAPAGEGSENTRATERRYSIMDMPLAEGRPLGSLGKRFGSLLSDLTNANEAGIRRRTTARGRRIHDLEFVLSNANADVSKSLSSEPVRTSSHERRRIRWAEENQRLDDLVRDKDFHGYTAEQVAEHLAAIENDTFMMSGALYPDPRGYLHDASDHESVESGTEGQNAPASDFDTILKDIETSTDSGGSSQQQKEARSVGSHEGKGHVTESRRKWSFRTGFRRGSKGILEKESQVEDSHGNKDSTANDSDEPIPSKERAGSSSGSGYGIL
jgi:hypothetical protein